MDRASRSRVAKLLPSLSSDKAGEVAATAAAIERTLRAAGTDWHALADAIRTGAPARGGGQGSSALEQWTDSTLRFFKQVGWDKVQELKAKIDQLERERRPTNWTPLTPTQRRRQSVVETIEAEPALTDREIARRIGCSPTTVGAIRRQVQRQREGVSDS